MKNENHTPVPLQSPRPPPPPPPQQNRLFKKRKKLLDEKNWLSKQAVLNEPRAYKSYMLLDGTH